MNFNILGGFQKYEYVLGYDKTGYFCGHRKSGPFLEGGGGGHLFIYILRPFLKVEVQNWNIFLFYYFYFFFFWGGGVAKFQIFSGGMPDI